ncbi:MAG: malectin domain-containing carbohydrate-binding protein [Bacteroidales bacterium]
MKKFYIILKTTRILSFLMMGIFVVSLFAASKAYGQEIAINCGGNEFTAADGTVFIADDYSTGGGTYTGDDREVANTEDDFLYFSERNGDFTYNIPVANGTYDVTIMIAEIYHSDADKRVFNVLLEDREVLTEFDPAGLAGKDVAIDKIFTVNITDGEIKIETVTIKDGAKLSAIKITEHSTNYVKWVEDFTLADGTMDDTGETAWTATRPGGTFQVADNMLVINDEENDSDVGEFTSEEIDISSGPVSISLDVAVSNGIDDGQDYIKLYAIIDGGDPVLLDSIDGEYLHGLGGTQLTKGDDATGDVGVLSGSGITGSTLKIYITSYLSAGSEYYYMDNLAVVEQTLPWIEDFSHPDGTTVDDGPTGWTAVREKGRLEVEDSTLIVNEGGTEPAVFTSDVIEIFGAPVNISLDVLCSGGLDDGQDFVRLYAIVDGGDKVLHAEKDAGSEGEAVILQGLNIVGNTLQIVIESYVSAGSEYYWMDNLTVEVSQITTYALITTAEHGSISRDPDKEVYEEGTEVTVSVTPDYGYAFTGWEGDATGTETSITVTMDSIIDVTALFEALPTYTLTTSVENGSVFQTPQRDKYAEGEEVVLKVQPFVGYEFIEWTGDLTGSENPVNITMDGNKTITAVITKIPAFTLSVSATNGSVQALPDQETYEPGSAVIIGATADDGYRFKEWTGDHTGTQNPTSVIMNADKSITAVFELIPASYTLTVGASTNGSVTLSPAGGTYEDGTEVTVTAVPDDGYEFIAWSGDMTGSDNPATITIDGDKSITAQFDVIISAAVKSGIEQSNLAQNYPNPFSVQTRIPYQLDKAAPVQLTIYNILGEKINTLVNAHQEPGSYEVEWNVVDANGTRLSNGVYFYRLEVNYELVKTQKAIVSQ